MMIRAFVGVISKRNDQVEQLIARASHERVLPHRVRLRLGEWHFAIDKSGEVEDVAHDADRVLLLDRGPSGGTSGPVDARVRQAAVALLRSTAAELVQRVHDPVSFVQVTADGTVALFRGLYSGRPIFYAQVDEAVVFGSELALVQGVVRRSEADRVAVAEMLLMRWNTGSRTLVDGILQVVPGQLVTVGGERQAVATTLKRPKYGQHSGKWTLAEATAATEAALRAELRALAVHHRKAVVTLSAGVDSSLILSLAREEFPEVVAVTADWQGLGNPELEAARSIASGLGVQHIGAVMEDHELPEIWRTVVDRMGAGPRVLSALPLLACFRRAAAEGGVVLYGVAADSLFGAEQIGWLALEQKRRTTLHALPHWLRQVVRLSARVVGREPGRLVPRLLDNTESQLFARDVSIEYRVDPRKYFPLYPEWPDTPAGFNEWPQEHAALVPEQRSQDYLLRIAVEEYLVMVTRLSEHAGVELVNMYTTPAVLEVAERIEPSMLFRDGVSKPILRDLAGRYVDRSVIEAPKLGFPTPNRSWLEGPLAAEVAEVRALAKSGAAAWWLSPHFAELPIARDTEAWWTALGLATTFEALGLDQLGPSR